MDPALRPRHIKALIKLSKASRLYPECLVLKGIDIGPYPVTIGTFGDVFKGQLYGRVVAVKALRFCSLDYSERLKVGPDRDTYKTHLNDYTQDFSSEAVIWRQLCHPNVLPFYGVYVDIPGRKLGLTSPWMVNGNVVEFLKEYPGTYCVHLVSQGYCHDVVSFLTSFRRL